MSRCTDAERRARGLTAGQWSRYLLAGFYKCRPQEMTPEGLFAYVKSGRYLRDKEARRRAKQLAHGRMHWVFR